VGAVHLKPGSNAQLDASGLDGLASQAKRRAKQEAGYSLYTIEAEQASAGHQSPALSALAL